MLNETCLLFFQYMYVKILHKGLSSENLMIGSEFYLKLTGVHTDNSSRHREPAMRQLKRTPSVSGRRVTHTCTCRMSSFEIILAKTRQRDT